MFHALDEGSEACGDVSANGSLWVTELVQEDGAGCHAQCLLLSNYEQGVAGQHYIDALCGLGVQAGVMLVSSSCERVRIVGSEPYEIWRVDHGRIVCALFAGRPRTWAPCKSRRCRLEWHG